MLLTSSQKKINMKWTCKRHTYERPGRQMHSFLTQFLVLMSACILAKLHPIIWSCISVWVFSYKAFQYSKTPFFRTLVYDGFYKRLLEILSKIVSLLVKLAIKCIKTLRKEKFQKQPVVILLKNGCSVRHMSYSICASLSVAKILEKHVQSSSCLA